MNQWFVKASSALQGHPKSVQWIYLPFGCVFVLGAQKEQHLMFVAVDPDLWGEECDA